MDSIVHSALEEICCEAAKGLHLRNLWRKLSPYLASKGLPLCPSVKRAVWENLVQIPGLKLEACDGGYSSKSTVDLINCTVEECEKMDVKIVAPEGMRKSFLGIYEMEGSESSFSDTQRLILERLAVARTNGIAQNELSKELRIASNNLFYQLKRLETQGLIVRQPTVIRTKTASRNRETKNDSVVTTNMLYLYRYGKHLGCQQRLEITKEDKVLIDRGVTDACTETNDDYGKDIAEEDVRVKDFLPALKAICDKLENAQGKVLVVSDIKRELGYLGTSGHRTWRNIFHRLKDAQIVEECFTMIKKKEVNCLRLLRSFSPSHFEPKLHGQGSDDIDMEQSMNLSKRGQITEQLVELPIMLQVYDMIDAAGSKGLTNTEVCRRLGLCSKEYHKRYFKQMISRFGLHLQLESHHKGEVYRVWTAGNFNPQLSNMAPIEREAVVQEVNKSASLVDLNFHETPPPLPPPPQPQPQQGLCSTTFLGNITDVNQSENDAAVITETSTDVNMDDTSSNILLLQCSPQSSDVELCNESPDLEVLQGSKSVTNSNLPQCKPQSSDVEVCNEAPDLEITRGSKSVTNNNLLEVHSSGVVTPTRRRSYPRYPRLTIGAISLQREQHILKMLQEEKVLVKADLHRRLETLEKEKNTAMDRKTLDRILKKLQQEGHCKCIPVSAPIVTNWGRDRTTKVVLHPSVYNYSPESLSEIIHSKLRSFDVKVRQQSYSCPKKVQSGPILDNVQRISSSTHLDDKLERAEVISANGFVLPKMVRVKLLHVFLWDWVCNSPGWDHGLSSTRHSYEKKNPHSTYKLFELDMAIRSMPLELFLQVVGSAQKIEAMLDKCRSGLLLCDLPEEYKDTRATGNLSLLVDILRRLKLIRLVSDGHAVNGASSSHTILTNALELKPYIEEPVSTITSSGSDVLDLRPQMRHDFVLSSRNAVDEYWNTLEYCYAVAKPEAALLAFPGSAVHEVFQYRSWRSSSVITAEQRTELLKHFGKDDRNKRLSFSECQKIAKDLNLTLEQVLRVYYDKQQRLTRFKSVLDGEGKEPQPVKGEFSVPSRKRKRRRDRMSSKRVKTSVADGQPTLGTACPLSDSDNQFTVEQQSWLIASEIYDCQLLRYYSGDNNGSQLLTLNEDKDADTFIHKSALSGLKSVPRRRFLWTEEADRQLVIIYATYRASRGAKFHRVDWASISSLPAPIKSCQRRMGKLNGYIPCRKAVMKLCNILAERYTKYLEKFQGKALNCRDSEKLLRDSALEEDSSHSSAPMSGKWADFDDSVLKVALDDVLRYKRMAKLETVQDTSSDHENCEDDDFEGFDGTKASDQSSSSQQLHGKYSKLSSKGGRRWMHESVAIANAVELFKLIFLSNSTAPEVPTLLAETLRRYSEHDLFAAFNYLKDKKIMIGGSSENSFALSQPFLHSMSLSTFPLGTGKRATEFTSFLHKRQKNLMEEGIDVPPDLQCGEVFTLCAQLSSGELSITPCLPNEGVGETEDYRTYKRKSDSNASDCGDIYKKSKTFTGEGEVTARREKGFPGIKLCLRQETIPGLLAIDLFKDEEMYRAPFFGRNEPNNTLSGLDVNDSSSHSDVTDFVREILDSGEMIHPASDVSESPWEAMTTYAGYLMSSCSYEVNSLFLQPCLFKELYSAIQKSGDNGLTMKEIKEVLDMEDEKVLEVIIEVLEAYGRALKVNAYNSIHVVDSLYRSKYFLTSVHGRAGDTCIVQKTKIDDEHMPRKSNNHREKEAALDNEINTDADEMHRVTILNLPEDVSVPPPGIFTKNKITGYQQSEVPPRINRVENSEVSYADTQVCRPLLPWINGDGTVNEPVYKGLIRRALGIVMQNPGILEDGIIKQMNGLNPQSCRRLLEIMIMDKHIITRKMHQKTSSAQPPSILGSHLGGKFRKSKSILRVHYFANPMSTDLL